MYNFEKIVKSPVFKAVVVIAATVFCGAALAAGTSTTPPFGLQKLAWNITQAFENVGSGIMAICYVLGVGFTCGGLLKCYQSKKNPTQIDISHALTMLGIGAALLFAPTLTSYLGETLFNDNEGNVAKMASGYTGENALPIGNTASGQ